MEREIGDQGIHESPLRAMGFPVICKRIDTSHWVLLLALKQSFVSLATIFRKIVWIQLLNYPREICKIAKVIGLLLLFVLIQGQANVSVKCLSFVRQKVFYLIRCDSEWYFLIDKKLITERKLHSCQRLHIMYCIGRR